MSTIETLHLARAMTRYGGEFSKRLAHAWFAADPDNRAKLEAAFGDLFANYAEFVETPVREPGADPFTYFPTLPAEQGDNQLTNSTNNNQTHEHEAE